MLSTRKAPPVLHAGGRGWRDLDGLWCVFILSFFRDWLGKDFIFDLILAWICFDKVLIVYQVTRQCPGWCSFGCLALLWLRGLWCANYFMMNHFLFHVGSLLNIFNLDYLIFLNSKNLSVTQLRTEKCSCVEDDVLCEIVQTLDLVATVYLEVKRQPVRLGLIHFA